MEPTKPTQKIAKSQLFGYIKECIKEMAKSGELSVILSEAVSKGQMPQQQMMYGQPVYQQPMQPMYQHPQLVPGNPVLNNLLVDTATNSLQEHMANDPQLQMQQVVQQQAQPMYQQQMQPVYQQQMQPQYNNGMPQQPMYQQPQQQMQTQRNGYTTNWAKLALSTPISNRPAGGSIGAGSLPGIRTGKFD